MQANVVLVGKERSSHVGGRGGQAAWAVAPHSIFLWWCLSAKKGSGGVCGGVTEWRGLARPTCGVEARVWTV